MLSCNFHIICLRYKFKYFDVFIKKARIKKNKSNRRNILFILGKITGKIFNKYFTLNVFFYLMF